MVTTVISTTTVTDLDSATADLLGIIAVATLIVVLIVKEVLSARVDRRRLDARVRFASQTLNAPILALLCVFLVLLVVRVWAAI
jgi:hypothetical protein